MKRSEVEQDHRVVDGIIQGPSKFEGEAVYLPACWEVYLDGCSEDVESEGTNYSRVDVDSEMKAEFPELEDKEFVVFYQRDDGFICEVSTSQEDWDVLCQEDSQPDWD